jgi:hypothetical protein
MAGRFRSTTGCLRSANGQTAETGKRSQSSFYYFLR